MAEPNTAQFIILPPVGLKHVMMTNPLLAPSGQAKPLTFGPGKGTKKPAMRVLDSVHEDGAKLVQMNSDAAQALRAEQPGLRIIPVVYYLPAIRPQERVEKTLKLAAGVTISLRLIVRDKATKQPLAGANLVTFTSFARHQGDSGISDAAGVVALRFGTSSMQLERLYVYPPNGYWGRFAEAIQINDGDHIDLAPIDLSKPDFLRKHFRKVPYDAGNGVKIGVIDSGIALNHPDLVVKGGLNAVTGEDPTDYGPSMDHGTHVAGIIGARGNAPTGVRGVAPGCDLYSYRVFGHGEEGASNFAIMKAIDQAVADGCDLINMSLGGGPDDEGTKDSIAATVAAGSVVVIAAGNDGRQPVAFPASYSLAVAVSAMGMIDTFPADSVETGDVLAPFGDPDKRGFIAAFSNIGSDVDITGPGVGVISTVPQVGYAAMSGTSMACPAVTGFSAWLLGKSSTILKAKRDHARSVALTKLLFKSAKRQGFGPNFEGHGLP